jgi:hypothetical protein
LRAAPPPGGSCAPAAPWASLQIQPGEVDGPANEAATAADDSSPAKQKQGACKCAFCGHQGVHAAACASSPNRRLLTLLTVHQRQQRPSKGAPAAAATAALPRPCRCPSSCSCRRPSRSCCRCCRRGAVLECVP